MLRKWLVGIVREAMEQISTVVPASTNQPILSLNCGHGSSSYSTDPLTGGTECLACYHKNESCVRGVRGVR